MAEAEYAGLPYTTLQNRRTPTTIYHIDADGLKGNYEALADGTAIEDGAITTRTISPELMVLIRQGISGVVDTFAELPDPETVAEGTLYLVKTQKGEDEAGVYRSNGVDEWVYFYNFADRFLELSDAPSSYDGQAGKFIKVNAGETALEFGDGGGGGGDMPSGIIEIMAGSWDYPATAPATLDTDSGTRLGKAHLFPTASDSSIIAERKLSPDLTSGDVTFEIEVYAKASTSSQSVAFVIGHYAYTDGESWDGSYTDVTFDVTAMPSGADTIKRITKTVSVATLGWAVNDTLALRLLRDVSEDDLAQDACVKSFRIIYPQA